MSSYKTRTLMPAPGRSVNAPARIHRLHRQRPLGRETGRRAKAFACPVDERRVEVDELGGHQLRGRLLDALRALARETIPESRAVLVEARVAERHRQKQRLLSDVGLRGASNDARAVGSAGGKRVGVATVRRRWVRLRVAEPADDHRYGCVRGRSGHHSECRGKVDGAVVDILRLAKYPRVVDLHLDFDAVEVAGHLQLREHAGNELRRLCGRARDAGHDGCRRDGQQARRKRLRQPQTHPRVSHQK